MPYVLPCLKSVSQSTLGGELKAHAHQLQAQIFPVALRFLADEWDDVSVTVHLFLTTVLAAVCISLSPSRYATQIQPISINDRKKIRLLRT